jgi:hypothetical protein
MSLEFLPDPSATQTSSDFASGEEIDSRRYEQTIERLGGEVERFISRVLQLVSGIGLRFTYRRWVDPSFQLGARDRDPKHGKVPAGWKEVRIVVDRRKGEWAAWLVVRTFGDDVHARPGEPAPPWDEQTYFFEQSGLEQLILWSQLASPFLSSYRAAVSRAIELATAAAERLEVVNEDLDQQIG